MTSPDGRPENAAETSGVDAPLVRRLRAGDEAMFREIVDSWSRVMLHVARSHVSTQEVAEEVVQDTWVAVLRGLDDFEGRSTFRTWVFQILGNIARSRGVRERRVVPLSSLVNRSEDDPATRGAPAVSPDRFRPAGQPWPGHWTDAGAPSRWDDWPAESAASHELRGRLQTAMGRLPPRQRAVLALRDVEGCSSDEVCRLLGLSAGNQRILLHRARTRMRALLEEYADLVQPAARVTGPHVG
jgi:RNA polymerase sigma-70 factor (ECF subfamily)